MERNRKKVKLQLSFRSKSPVVMSRKSKINSAQSNVLCTSKVHSLDTIEKKNQEATVQPMDNSTLRPLKISKHFNLRNNLQSTPNTQHFQKSVIDTREIMNLSPIASSSSEKIKSKICGDIQCEYPTDSILKDQLNNESSTVNRRLQQNKCINESSLQKKTVGLLGNSIRKDENCIKEKAKRCLFENEKKNNTSSFNNDQDSLNISFDILEQVCQMSEMMDDSSTGQTKMNDYTNKNNNQLSFFLYGNSSTKLEDTEKENDLLQLALSMEDNLITETKPKNNLCFDKEFTSLNQLKNKENNQSKTIKTYNIPPKNNIDLSGCKFIDSLEVNEISNTQLCEIADITEPLESFNDQWSQQYISEIFNPLNEKQQNSFHIFKPNLADATFEKVEEYSESRINMKKKDVLIPDKKVNTYQLGLKNELNNIFTLIEEQKIINPHLYKGFSTAGGKSIKVSDEALKKVHSMLKDELQESSIVSKEKIMSNPNLSKGFLTAGGKSINVADKALKKVHSLLKDEQQESSIVSKEKIMSNPNLNKGFSTAGGKSIKVSDEALQKVHSLLKDELQESSIVSKEKIISNPNLNKRFSTAGCESVVVSNKVLKKVETMPRSTSCLNLNEEWNVSKLNYNSKATNQFSENFKNEEEFTLEDISLLETVEKFERNQIAFKSVLNNKRPGNPTFENSHKIKKKMNFPECENEILKTSFDLYLSKKLNDPKISLLEAVDRVLPKKCDIKQLPKNSMICKLIKSNMDNTQNLNLPWENSYELSEVSENKTYSFQDIKILFLSHHIVDDKLISKGWIENHFHWIVWKLVALELRFPNHFGSKLLTAKNVIHQLLYRYYREIEKCQRSPLKKILEKDETSTKRIILCVSKVIKKSIETYNIELTDGWYRVQGLVDFEMNMLLHKGIVKVGTKLIIYNAELIGAGGGIDPLEVHDGIKLKISTNSIRRVRWYTKLGFCKYPTIPLPISLESVLPRGGMIGSLSLVILRKYPKIYFERKPNSKPIFRNEKMEIIEEEKYKTFKQKTLEFLSNKIEAELMAEMATKTKKSTNTFLSLKKDSLDQLSIEELSNVLENCVDPSEIETILSQDKLEALKHFKKSEHEKFIDELKNRVDRAFKDQFKDDADRKVIPLVKLRVVDEKYSSTGLKSAMLTIWNPSEDIYSILNKTKEGQCCKFYHLTTTGLMNGELQISACKNTRFDFQSFKNNYVKREIVSFKSILTGIYLPLFGELDLVGIVVSNVNKNNGNYDEVYVSDNEMNIVNIRFKGDIKEHGCDDIIYPGSIISGVNILFRSCKQVSFIPKLYATELSSFTTIPKAEHLVKMFDEYNVFIKKSENQNFLKCCQSKLDEIINKSIETATTSIQVRNKNSSKNEMHRSYEELPITVLKTPNTSLSEYSPAHKRIKMLSTFGKTPPLNIVHTKPPDKKLMSQFKIPTRL